MITSYPTMVNGIIVLVNSQTGFCRGFLFPQLYRAEVENFVQKIFKLDALFPYDVKLRLLAHSRSFFSQSKS